MKRKLIQKLLATDQLPDDLVKLLPDDGPDIEAARQVLAAVLQKFSKAVRSSPTKAAGATPEAFYVSLSGATPEQLSKLIEGTEASALTKRKQLRAQVFLTDLLTSKAGRPRVSDLTRQEQNAAAQSRRRDRLKNNEGRKRVDVWIRPAASAYLDAIQKLRNCDSQADALEMVLESAMKGEVLQLPKAQRHRAS